MCPLSRHASSAAMIGNARAYGFVQLGIEKLAWGGRLYVDGERTDNDPYSCETSGERLLVVKSFSMQSYTKMAHISCPNGIAIQSHKDTEMSVNMTGTFLKGYFA